MSGGRIPTELWVGAGIRRASMNGVAATVVRKGEVRSGTVVLKLFQSDRGCRVFTQTRDIDGNLTWFPAFDGNRVGEPEADAYIERQVSRDPDLWVIEVESREGWNPFDFF